MPNCIGETNLFKPKSSRRDEEGQIILEPRNFTTKKAKAGHTDAVFFSKPTYVSVEDPFKQSKFQMRDLDPNSYLKGGHDNRFKPAKTVPERYYKAPYAHQSDRVEVKKETRDEDGKPITGPRNFYTNPNKKGITAKGTTFNKFPDHVPDDYNYPRTVAKKEFEAGKALE